jgi:hypothetical protein
MLSATSLRHFSSEVDHFPRGDFFDIGIGNAESLLRMSKFRSYQDFSMINRASFLVTNVVGVSLEVSDDGEFSLGFVISEVRCILFVVDRVSQTDIDFVTGAVGGTSFGLSLEGAGDVVLDL